MFKFLRIIFLAGGVCGLSYSFVAAQNEVDAARYSSFTSGGTARSLGMAGAFSAVGADLSSTWLNPAGLALYRRSEIAFTPT